MSELTTRLVTTEEEFLKLEPAWTRLHTETAGTIFQSYEWLRKWWIIYQQPRFELRLFLISDGDTLVGLLPMFLEKTKLGPIHFRRLRFLGVYEIYGEYSPLIHPEHTWEVTRLMGEYCANQLKNRECDLVSFFRFAPTSPAMGILLNEIGFHTRSMQYLADCLARVTMTLPSSWEKYLAGISETEREMIKRRSRSLFKNGVSLEIITSPSEKSFEDFVRLHTATWQDKGINGYFAASPRFEQFQREVTATLMNQGRGKLYFFVKDGIRLAAVQAFFTNQQCCFYLSGLDRHHPLIRYSPGKVLLSLVIKDAIEQGYTTFDFQGGLEEYKFKLGGKRTSFSKMIIWKDGRFNLKVVLFLSLTSAHQYIKTTLLDLYIFPFIRQVGRKFRASGTPLQVHSTPAE